MAPDAGRIGTPRIVVLTGPESTGKTTLAARLRVAYACTVSDEFAREYVNEHAHALGADDVEAIAHGQIMIEERARARALAAGHRLLVKDTDLLSTVVYARHYHGHCPEWVVHAALERRGDLYLLCAPDVPWVSDGRQRPASASPTERASLYEMFSDELRRAQVATMVIAGDWPRREREVLASLRAWLGPPPDDERGEAP